MPGVGMSGRKPTKDDLETMTQTIALVTAYDLGCREGDFSLFTEMTKEVCKNDAEREALRSSIQFSWLLLRSLETRSGLPRDKTLKWYGQRFARRMQNL